MSIANQRLSTAVEEPLHVPPGAPSGSSFASGKFVGESNAVLVLAMLILVNVFTVVDRQIVGVLAVPIKRDLGLTDTQLGLMGGLSFAVFYCTLAIPMARWADHKGRAMVIALSLATWSLMTTLCGFAQNFLQLFIARGGVGIGEAGGITPCYSLIADYFPPHQRARALGAHSCGVPIGSAISALIGGVIATYVDWRWAFIVVGVAGLLFVLPFRLIVKEPPRGRYDKTNLPAGSFIDVVRLVARKPTFWAISLAGGNATVMVFGAQFWLPSFFVRSYGLSLLHASAIVSVLQLVGGITGLVLGGIVADRLGRRSRRGYILVPAFGCLAAVPLYLAALWSEELPLTVAMLFIPMALSLSWVGPILTTVQHLARPAMRTTVSALFSAITNLYGLFTGIVIVGALSDLLARQFGAQSLRYSLATCTGFMFFAFLLFLLASRSVERDWEE